MIFLISSGSLCALLAYWTFLRKLFYILWQVIQSPTFLQKWWLEESVTTSTGALSGIKYTPMLCRHHQCPSPEAVTLQVKTWQLLQKITPLCLSSAPHKHTLCLYHVSLWTWLLKCLLWVKHKMSVIIWSASFTQHVLKVPPCNRSELFLRLYSIPLCICILLCLPIPPLMDMWVAPSFWLLARTLLV